MGWIGLGGRGRGFPLPKVECFHIPGLRAWFWSHDHEPMHFHVEKPGVWEITVDILASARHLKYALKWGQNGPSAAERKVLLRQVRLHKAALIDEWNRKVNHG